MRILSIILRYLTKRTRVSWIFAQDFEQPLARCQEKLGVRLLTHGLLAHICTTANLGTGNPSHENSWRAAAASRAKASPS